MSRNTDNWTSRRDFLRLAAGSAAFGPFFLFPQGTLASQKTLKIAKWAHFLPEFDVWFQNVLANEWGNKHDTNVIVDDIPVEQVYARASAEVKVGKGHDVFIFPWPPAEYQQHVIDHAEVIQQVASKHGNIEWMAHRSSVNLKTKKYFAFADSWIPAPFLFFQDYWSEVNLSLGPVHYDGLRGGGKRLREKLGIPCGLALAPSLETTVTFQPLRTASPTGVLDKAGRVFPRTAAPLAPLQ